VWAKASISRIEDNLLEVVFENDHRRMTRLVYWYSSDIDKFDTQSSGDQWRADAKVGDLVDAYDTTRQWYESTVIDRRYRNDNGNEFIELNIGFRVY
jgi:hypothetical protein